jgi:hypothetical protein
MLRDFERGDMVQYFDLAHGGIPFGVDNPVTGLIVDVEYHVKPDDFLIFIMWPDAGRPQALFQKDCHHRGLKVLD